MTAIANLPDIRPSLLLDFANSGRVDPRIQCTRASAATCFGPDGKLRTVPANVPRIDYDPVTGKCLGLLVEEARTNLILQSGNLSVPPWSATRATVIETQQGVRAPSGGAVYKLVEDSSLANTHAVGQNVRLSPSTTYTFSVSLRAGERVFATVTVGRFSTQLDSQTLRINLLTGSVVGGAQGRYTIQTLGAGWFRLSTTVTTQSTITQDSYPTIGCALSQNAAGESYDGDGVSGIYVADAQIEAGTFPTSYIPTEASAVTRAADLVLQNPLSLPSSKFSAALSSTQHSIASMTTVSIRSEASNSNLRVVNMPTGRSRLEATVAGQNTNLASTQTPVITTVDRRIAVSYDGAIAMLSLNGSSTTSEALAVDLLTPELVIGKASRTTTLSLFSGWLQRLAIYPAALSAAQLQRLTA